MKRKNKLSDSRFDYVAFDLLSYFRTLNTLYRGFVASREIDTLTVEDRYKINVQLELIMTALSDVLGGTNPYWLFKESAPDSTGLAQQALSDRPSNYVPCDTFSFYQTLTVLHRGFVASEEMTYLTVKDRRCMHEQLDIILSLISDIRGEAKPHVMVWEEELEGCER